MSEGSRLQALRRQIDAIDRELQRLLNERARCALDVAEVKREADGERPRFYRPEREAQVLRRVKEQNRGPLPDDSLARLFREIISCCMALEQTLTVTHTGGEGGPARAAALKHFGHAVRTTGCADAGAVCRSVAEGRADYGVLALGELLALDGMPAALYACGEVLLPATTAAEGRFLVFGEQPVAPSGHDRTVLWVLLPDRPGELMRLLAPFAERQINSKVAESVELPGRFFVELDGHRDDSALGAALAACFGDQARPPVLSGRVLGSYPVPVL